MGLVLKWAGFSGSGKLGVWLEQNGHEIERKMRFEQYSARMRG
jgi:hypothetical protein